MASKILIRSLALLTLLIFSASCNHTKGLTQALENKPPRLDYLHEPSTVSQKSGLKILVQTQVQTAIPTGEYRGKKTYFIPLILYWHFYSKKMMNLFSEQLETPADESLRKNLIEDIERHTAFSVTDNPAQADYKMFVTADSISTFCFPQIKTHLFIVPLGPILLYLYNSNYSYAGALSYSKLNYQLYDREDELILTKSTVAQEKIPFYEEQALYAVPETYSIMMHGTLVSALASNFKSNVNDMVNELNLLNNNHDLRLIDTDQRWGRAE